MADRQDTSIQPVLVAADIAKNRHEILIEVPGHKQRRRLTVLNTRGEFERLAATLLEYGRPVRVAFEATGNYHRAIAYHLSVAGFEMKLVSSVALARTREAARRFRIGISTAGKWYRRFRETGELKARKQGQPSGSKLDPHEDFILGLIEEQPDITLVEIAEALASQRGTMAAPSTVWVFLDKRGITFKKRRPMPQNSKGLMSCSVAGHGSKTNSTLTQTD